MLVLKCQQFVNLEQLQKMKVLKRKLPKLNGRVGALPPLEGHGVQDDQELSSKRARSL